MPIKTIAPELHERELVLLIELLDQEIDRQVDADDPDYTVYTEDVRSLYHKLRAYLLAVKAQQ